MADRQLVSSGSPFEPTVGYSRAVRVGDRVWVSGTAPIWPEGAVDPDVEVQARRCFEIIESALATAGAALTDVVRTRIFLVDVADMAVIGRVHGELFGDIRPACTAVAVAALLDPRWKLEVEAEAVCATIHGATNPGGAR